MSNDLGFSQEEEKALSDARDAAIRSINEIMQRDGNPLATYLALLETPYSREYHRFAPMLDWAREVLDDPTLRYAFSISRITLNRWISGEATPDPLARQSVLNKIQKLINAKMGA